MGLLKNHIGLLFVLCCLTLVSVGCKAEEKDTAQSKEHESTAVALPEITLPFEARTTDECIREKECVWWAFDRMVRRPIYSAGKKPSIKKWFVPVRIIIFPDRTGIYSSEQREDVQAAIDRVQPHFPYSIVLTKDEVNVSLMFSDDFMLDLFGTFRKTYFKLFDKYLFEEFQRFQIVSHRNTCLSYPFIDKSGEIFSSALFIRPEKKYRDQCIESRVFYNLGFTSTSFAFQQFPADDYNKMTDLHFFLIRVLYHPKMKPGILIDDAKSIVDDIHPEILNSFLSSHTEKDISP